MGSPCEIKLLTHDLEHARRVLETCVQKVKHLNDKYSRYDSNSVVSRINQQAGSGHLTTLDEETQAILNYADVCHAESSGVFDITSGVLRKAWDFKALHAEHRLPSPDFIQELLQLVGWGRVYWQNHQFALPEKGMEIDLGGVVKEYAADVVHEILSRNGISSALVDLGGDIRILSHESDSSSWDIFLKNPFSGNPFLAKIKLRSGGVATSGTGERFFEIEGKRYSHLLNPMTGWPVEKPAASLTILAEQCIIAGSIASIGLLKGKDCLAWLENNIELPYWCCLEDGSLNMNEAARLITVTDAFAP